MGASTGRDGIGGASVLASAELEEGDDGSARACRSATRSRRRSCSSAASSCSSAACCVSLQDLGAAGLPRRRARWPRREASGSTSTSSKVPLREADLEPFEVMVSESQERMLAVVEPGQARRGGRGLRALADRRRRDRRGHRQRRSCASSTAARWSATSRSRRWSTSARSTTSSPRSPTDWMYGNAEPCESSRERRPSADRRPAARALLASPNVASKRWAFEQYDSVVGSRTVRRPEDADAAVLDAPRGRPRDRGRDRRQRAPRRLRPVRGRGRGRARVRAEPRLRRRRAARADQLPQLRQPREAAASPGSSTARCSGLADACVASASRWSAATSPSTTRPSRARSTRRRSSAWSASCPIPARAAGIGLAAEGDAIALVGPFAPSLAGSELAKQRGELDPGLPRPRSARSPTALASVREAVRDGPVTAAHDVSDGGLACALAECAIAGGSAPRPTSTRWSSCAEGRARAAFSARGPAV